ncbi:helix-turn-helix domain-containing protein [Vibrio vulnificus]|uniref:Transcriptional regulator n=1 Tax=Vibrio vulnificus TaxID=672 RepID=A0A854GQX4_VIBVL|nr:helix-turn-helix domain-containing protein [Vibrio vulnificus]EGQ7930310.1 transcriptional regulator [Vibrio vulnificus]EGQ7938474.1 transcriptional regulator [Vibrio vulnificus]EGQ7951873.1 transcriptional regulator [Vibrio vulnificus]EGQ7995901.1 transcriptional regulator [Vibrio vulnificus]EGQ8091622.1 transcriptional regulator [Vibrio vulnificus]
MNYTNLLLDRVKARYELSSDYKLAQKLGVGRSRLSHWRSGTCSMEWEVAFQIADLLGEEDQNVVFGLLDDKYKNPRLINALHAGAPA